ncbi:MAG TPA: BBP7 family outer membrane beta-barrel protein, partial [Fimbriiglobus sp.]
MPVRFVVLAIMLVVVPARLPAQPPGPVTPIPPLVPVETTGLPVGTEVSRPLTAVQAPVISAGPTGLNTVTPPPEIAKAAEPKTESTGLHRWDSSDLLLWWYKAQSLPPLVSAGRGGAIPSLDSPNTALLVGGRQLASGMDGGGRFILGVGLGDDNTVGYEIGYTFLGGQTGRFNSVDLANRGLVLARPFFNTTAGREDAFVVANPAGPAGYVDVATSTRVSSWEVNGVGTLYDGPNAGLILLAGYRYFRLKDGLRVESASVRPDGTVLAAADQFDAGNQFHGAQVGFKADLRSGSAFVEVVGKVALGQNNERVDIGGQSNVLYGGNLVAAAPGGLLAVASNTGRFTNGTFAVLPEAGVKV